MADTEQNRYDRIDRKVFMMGSLGEQVRQRRRHLGLRQEELADLAGVSPSFVRFVEHDKASVRLDKVQDVLNVLGLEMTLKVKTT